MQVGGTIESVTLGGRTFEPAADISTQRILGGWQNNVLANGNGGVRLIKLRVPGQLNGFALAVDDSRGDQEFLQELADRKNLFPATFVYPSGEIYQGNMQIVDELAYSNDNATATFALKGSKLTKQ
jgi:hypothetical protein